MVRRPIPGAPGQGVLQPAPLEACDPAPPPGAAAADRSGGVRRPHPPRSRLRAGGGLSEGAGEVRVGGDGVPQGHAPLRGQLVQKPVDDDVVVCGTR